jgi:hypothetical protein
MRIRVEVDQGNEGFRDEKRVSESVAPACLLPSDELPASTQNES